jgi:hypothetical protein
MSVKLWRLSCGRSMFLPPDLTPAVHHARREPDVVLILLKQFSVDVIRLNDPDVEAAPKRHVNSTPQQERILRIPCAIPLADESSSLAEQRMSEEHHLSSGKEELRSRREVPQVYVVAILAGELGDSSKVSGKVPGHCRIPAVQIRSAGKAKGRGIKAGVRIPAEELQPGNLLGFRLGRSGDCGCQEKQYRPAHGRWLGSIRANLAQDRKCGNRWVCFHSEV